ncbi:hypothetical protein BD413DRAFT_601726 [Trametes elegans]|nr:hypothetical protein BD413DRAFT_601726 [Trametes elegans]
MSASAASSSSAASRPTIFGLFDRSTTPELDIEAQLQQPSPARTHSSRSSHSSASATDEPTTNAIDDFFGASRSSSSRSLLGTHNSRHDDVCVSTPADDDVESQVPPPSYECSLDPPAYSRVADQPTLAMYLFKFGFLFPLFWIAGAFILLSPLEAPSDWESSKPEYERQEIIESMRRTEIKWAKRCLWALLATALVAAAVITIALLVMKS